MNWLQSGRTDRFRYVVVEWPTFREIETLGGITACTITDNSLSSMKSSGTLTYVVDPDVGENMIRVYSDSELDGDSVTVCHGTFFVTTPAGTWSGMTDSGTADMYSVLWILQQNKMAETYTVPTGANAVDLAASLARGFDNNLQVIATPSSKRVTTTHTWDAGTTYLEIINWLLDFADYDSASVDAFGNVALAPYVKPADKTPVVTFSDTHDTVSEPSFSHEFDTFEVPNKVVCICTNSDTLPMVATAINEDPENPYSIPARNKTLMRVEQVSDISDQASLQAKAEEILQSSMSVVESVEITHAFQPFEVGDAIQMHYRAAGYVKKMVSVSREKQMIPGIRCKTKARRFVSL